MLVLSRRNNETLVITGPSIVEVVEIRGSRVKLGITATPDVKITRGELVETSKDNQPATRAA